MQNMETSANISPTKKETDRDSISLFGDNIEYCFIISNIRWPDYLRAALTWSLGTICSLKTYAPVLGDFSTLITLL